MRSFHKNSIFWGFLLLAAGISFYLISHAGTWLLVSDQEPARIDVIFTFAGEVKREEYALRLLKKHPETHWYASTFYRQRLFFRCQKAGLDSTRVTAIDSSRNTWAEIRALRNILRKNTQIHTVGLVSSEWHMRRIFLMIRHIHLPEFKFYSLPVSLSITGPKRSEFKRWFWTAPTRKIVSIELLKIVYYASCFNLATKE